MKEKGFTLIELLAVIILLSLIALVATPVLINTIKNTEENTNKMSIDLYASAVKDAIARTPSSKVISGQYTTTDGKKLTLLGNPETELIIEYNGNVVCNTIEIYKDENIYLADCKVNTKDVDYTYGIRKLDNGILCKANTSKAIARVWTGNDDPGLTTSYEEQEVGSIAREAGAYTPGVAYTCDLGDGEETFYVLEESGYKVSLLLGRNLGSAVAWSSDGNNHKDENESAQAVTAKAALRERTTGWTKLNSSQISMPTYDQIYKAAENKTSELPTWLISYTKFTTDEAYHGYWTSTPHESTSSLAYSVLFSCEFYVDNVVNSAYDLGIRPVITISKSSLS